MNNRTPATQIPSPTHNNPVVQFKHDLDAVLTREMDFLDDGSRARMKNAMMTAVTRDPEILLADRASVFGAIRMCAAHGVVPDGSEATIQIYNTKVKVGGQEKWVKKATYLPMIRGIVNRVIRSGKIKLFYAEVVYENETFRIDMTHGDRRPVHEFDPMKRGDDEHIAGAYSVAAYENGIIDVEPMTRHEIDKVRNVAKTKKVWDGWYSEKAKVAVMKRHAKRLPLSAEAMDFILNRDEADFDQTPDEPEATKANLAQRISEPAAVEGEVVHDEAPIDLSEAFPGSDEFTEGAKAFQEGKSDTDCPYANDRQKATDWLGGYEQAKEAAA